MSEWGFRAGKFPWVRRLTQRKFNSFIVNVVPMTNEDERALSIARPNVGMWLDKLRRAGHVVLVRQYRLGGRPNAGYRINVDGQTMTIWELWARFRSELVDWGDRRISPGLAPRTGHAVGAADLRAGSYHSSKSRLILPPAGDPNRTPGRQGKSTSRA
jgi:hypothetical protein